MESPGAAKMYGASPKINGVYSVISSSFSVLLCVSKMHELGFQHVKCIGIGK